MKRELMNPNNIQNKINNQSKETLEIYSLVQKVGKGKRRHQLTLSKSNKKIIYKMMKEMHDIMVSQGNLNKSFQDFIKHLESEIKVKNDFRVSYEELILLRKVISLSIKELAYSQPKWYQILKKFYISMMLLQYKNLLKVLNL